MKNLFKLTAFIILNIFGQCLWANEVLVYKEERQMIVLNNSGQIIRTYHISLGGNPIGHKKRQGDQRTPEGEYILDYKNPSSEFTKSIHISYPNAKDILEGRTGNFIMIHGFPTDPVKYKNQRGGGHLTVEELYEILATSDWTSGCIGLTNEDMRDFYSSISIPTKIKIYANNPNEEKTSNEQNTPEQLPLPIIDEENFNTNGQ